jgi:DNA-binding GntR family transcriptional regulator
MAPDTPTADQGPLQRVTLRDQARARIRHLILTGALPSGQAFSEAVLASTLGISRTPVREAIQQLTNEGLLDATGFSGVRVHVVTDEEQEEIILLRSTLEVLAVKRLATTATKEQIDSLKATLARQAEFVDEKQRWSFLEMDQAFHLQLAEFARLTLTQKILRDIRNLFYLMGLAAVTIQGRSQAVMVEHRRIVDALARHDPEAAADAVLRHLDHTRRMIAASALRPGTGSEVEPKEADVRPRGKRRRAVSAKRTTHTRP